MGVVRSAGVGHQSRKRRVNGTVWTKRVQRDVPPDGLARWARVRPAATAQGVGVRPDGLARWTRGSLGGAVARAALSVPLSLVLMAGCSPPVAYALEPGDGEGLQATAVTAEDAGLEVPDDDGSALYSAYRPVLLNAAKGLGEFSEHSQAVDSASCPSEYFLFDFEANGVPELMVRTKTCNGVSIVHVFSAESGRAAEVGSYWEWFGKTAGNNDGELFVAGWNRGNAYVSSVSLKGGRVVTRFLKSGRATAENPEGGMQVVSDHLAAHHASWITSSNVSDDTLLRSKARCALDKGTLTVGAAEAYTGSTQTPQVTVKFGGTTLKQGRDYAVSYRDNVNAGLAGVEATGLGDYEGVLTGCFSIAKAENPLKVKAVNRTIAMKSLAKKPQTYNGIRFQAKAGKVSFENASTASTSRVVSVNRRTGALTVKRGAKPRTYTVKVRVSATGDANRKAASVVVPVKVRVG